MQHQPLALAISMALATPSVLAASAIPTDEQTLEHMVVVSSRIEMPIRQIATSVSVVTQDDIDARGYINLAEVLKVQPSINVSSNGSVGSISTLRIRGEEGYRTLVRIDGVDISDPTGPQVQPQFGDIQSANISRIEILRGSQGLAYGADAGGVINIQSGSGQGDMSGNIAAEYGRYNSTNLAADIGGASNKFDYYVSASDYATDGFNSKVSDSQDPDADGYDNTTLHARLGYQISDQLKLGFVARNTNGDGEFDGCGFGDSASNNCSSEFEQTNLRATANYAHNTSEHVFSFAKTFVQRDSLNQGQLEFGSKGTVERLEYLGNTQLNQASRLVYGLDWEQESITSADQRRIKRGYYLEYQNELLSNWFITAGLRHDDNEDFGEHTSYRVSSAYIWDVDDNELKLRGAYGTGFRAPSLYEIEYNRGPYSYAPAADLTLKEESTQGYEVALAYTLSSGSRFEAIYFNQQIDDSLYFDLATFSGYLQDDGQSRSEGVELIADIALSEHTGITANYTYNETQDTAGQQRILRPRNMANLGVYYHIDAFKLSAHIRAVHDFIDVDTKLDDYEVFDFTARYTLNEALSVSARIENAFDTQYQDVATYNTSGAAGYLGVKYQF
ncbi:MAG: vitamin B12 transporter [Paraglaciecola sp.]|jgi:vitamin B12 transporter